MTVSTTVSQLCANAIVTSSVIALVGLGFALVYFVGRFFHFAHGVIFTSGAYFTFLYASYAGLALTLSIALAICSATVLGCLIEILIYRPLRQKSASSLVVLLVSLGVYIVLQNIISAGFGDDFKNIRSGVTPEGITILGARMTSVQILTVSVSAALVATAAAVVRRTRLGKAMRAIGDDPELSSVSGINRDRVMLWCIALSSALAGTAGILVALDVGMVPAMGMEALMMAVVVVVVGGVGSVSGVMLAALFLGFARHFGAWVIGSEWQDAIAFTILLAFLLVRPGGFLGKKPIKAAV